MIKRQKKAIATGEWLNTYADMVTLLLCFFVLLFAASSLDKSKWQILVKSLNPSASQVSQIVNEMSQGEDTSMPADTTGVGMMTDVESFTQLYWQLEEYIQQNKLEADVEAFQGPGYTFIVFRNNIFFDGDKYNLKPGGKQILDFLCSGLTALADEIKEIKVYGHTNQADPNQPNEVRGDRFLASNRATEVLVYMQEKSILDPKKLVSMGYGQFYPVAPFVLEEDRVKNRRVEILIQETNAIEVSLEEVYANLNREEDAIGVEDIPAEQTTE